jgi:hypothetical protein
MTQIPVSESLVHRKQLTLDGQAVSSWKLENDLQETQIEETSRPVDVVNKHGKLAPVDSTIYQRIPQGQGAAASANPAPRARAPPSNSITSTFKRVLGGPAGLILPVFVVCALAWGVWEGRHIENELKARPDHPLGVARYIAYVCMYACMHVCMYACIYDVCMYVYVY